MSEIHPSIASHRLSVISSSRPICQKVRRFHSNRQRIIKAKVEKLPTIGFIREVEYPEWLENVVVVPKKGDKWRVCIDYTNLNDVCPNDSWLLPQIDQIIDSTARHDMLSFIDAFSSYHQILMFQLDEEKTSFVTPHGIYCYKVMPFWLKKARATYQRLMTKIFRPLIGQSMEMYIDNIVIKSKTRSEHTRHLKETFRLMKTYNMKLNPAKCAFGVNVGKFLGFMVTQRGIKVNLDQIKAVTETFSPSSKKELQHLTGRLVVLERFIAWFTEKLRPFFLTLKGASAIGWKTDCELAFEKIKCYLTQSPILSSPQPGEQLYMYLAGFDCAVSAILFCYVKDKEQRPVYYVSKAMVDAKTRYSKMEQTTLALRSVAWKLRPYFQAHQLTVLTNKPLRNILHKPDLSGRLVRSAIELNEYGIKY